MTYLIFLSSKITVDGDCSHEIKRHLLLGKKAMTNLDSILRSRDIIFLTKFHTIRAMLLLLFFPSNHVQMWEFNLKEGWTPNNWCFWTAVPEKTLESPLDNKEIKPVNPKGNEAWIWILERLMLQLKLQYFGHLMQAQAHWKRLWCFERLKAKGGEGDRQWDGCMASSTRWTWIWANFGR